MGVINALVLRAMLSWTEFQVYSELPTKHLLAGFVVLVDRFSISVTLLPSLLHFLISSSALLPICLAIYDDLRVSPYFLYLSMLDFQKLLTFKP